MMTKCLVFGAFLEPHALFKNCFLCCFIAQCCCYWCVWVSVCVCVCVCASTRVCVCISFCCISWSNKPPTVLLFVWNFEWFKATWKRTSKGHSMVVPFRLGACMNWGFVWWLVACLLNFSATCSCILGTDTAQTVVRAATLRQKL